MLALALLLLLPGCQRTARMPARPLRVAIYSDLQGLDPHFHAEVLTVSILSNLYEGLTIQDAEARTRPALAASWESPDDLTWRFHLRPDVLFHDGRSLTAADVVFSLERARHHPRTQVANHLVGVKEIHALNERTVEIHTEQPFAILLNKLAEIMIVPRDSPEEITRPVGTGPYSLDSSTPGKRLVLRRFDRYWGGRVPEERAELLILSDPIERAERLIAGDVDLVVELGSAQVARVQGVAGCRAIARDGLVMVFLAGRLDRPPFSDLRVRRAVHLALDREDLVRRVLLGYGRAAGQLVGSDVFGYSPALKPPNRNLAEARRLLAEAGYPSGLEVDLEFRPGRRVEEIRQQLAEAGIHARLLPRPWKELFPRLLAGHVGFYIGGLLADGGDASSIFDTQLHTSDPARGYGETNFNHYFNPQFDALVERSGTIFSMRERREVLEQAMQIAMEDLPLIPVWVQQDLYGARQDVDWRPRFDGRLLLRDVRRVPPR